MSIDQAGESKKVINAATKSVDRGRPGAARFRTSCPRMAVI
jgi:hypothetical protein